MQSKQSFGFVGRRRLRLLLYVRSFLWAISPSSPSPQSVPKPLPLSTSLPPPRFWESLSRSLVPFPLPRPTFLIPPPSPSLSVPGKPTRKGFTKETRWKEEEESNKKGFLLKLAVGGVLLGGNGMGTTWKEGELPAWLERES